MIMLMELNMSISGAPHFYSVNSFQRLGAGLCDALTFDSAAFENKPLSPLLVTDCFVFFVLFL